MVAMFARTPLASERLAPHPGPAGRPGPAPAARRSRGLTTLAAAAGCGPPRGDAPSVRGEQAVLAEQRLEPLESLQVLGAETIMEAAQVALHLRLAPAGTRLAAGDLRQRGEPRGERGFQEGAGLGLPSRAGAPSARPRRRRRTAARSPRASRRPGRTCARIPPAAGCACASPGRR